MRFGGRRLFGGGGGAVADGGLAPAALSPMVDVLTILLVAVLRTWSADPPFQPPEPGFVLPQTREEAPPSRGVTVDVGTDGVYVAGWRAGSARFWQDSEDILMTDLYEALQQQGGTTAVIRAHETAPWSLVGKVLFTAQQAGYGQIELVAVSRASL
ncbi:MAG: biopolymer transporter ExbD [Myxococcota bacterium]|nr:biopolymer transporter ExbD [Myxococcota bacterium]MEC8423712.1 biopolymer transporter ExbD [Myxococcota bacterium]